MAKLTVIINTNNHTTSPPPTTSSLSSYTTTTTVLSPTTSPPTQRRPRRPLLLHNDDDPTTTSPPTPRLGHSLGGATGAVGFTSDAQAQAFADTIWDLFLGGASPDRPFGAAVLDGYVTSWILSFFVFEILRL